MSKKQIFFVAKLTFTVALFVLLFRPHTFGLRPDVFGGVTPSLMLQELREAGARNIAIWLMFAIVVKLCGMFAGLIRWRLLLQGQGLQIPFFYMIKSWFIGRMIGTFLPGTIGLDGYRLLDSSRYTGELVKCTTVIVVEKLIGFIALTFLVFMTFPLGFRLLNIKVPVLAFILLCLAGFVFVSLTLLFNPRVIQVLVSVFPTPKKIRTQIDKFGQAVTAYSGNRRALLLAVFCGVLVHLGTALMFFGTMMAIKAENTSLLDILFAAPIMIYGTVIGPSIGGEGIREIVFVSLLSAKSGAAAAATFAHLGWWVDQFVPFTLGAGFFFLTQRPTKEQLLARMAEMRAEQKPVDVSLHLTPEAISEYRKKLLDCMFAGFAAGLIGGAVIGFGEAVWMARFLLNPSELMMYWWAPLVYGLVFIAVGKGIAAGLAFLYLLMDRFPRPRITFASCALGTVLAGGTVIGIFRVMRDVLNDHMPAGGQLAQIVMVAGALGIVLAAIGFAMYSILRENRILTSMSAVALYCAIILLGAVKASTVSPVAVDAAAIPAPNAASPNIILVAIDTLRADYLKLYDPEAVAVTPNFERLATDSILYKNNFSQCSWTKPSFASIFTGLYPSTHTTTGYKSALPDSVTTIAEALRGAGYYTKGFANNPNISPEFNFGQGFESYIDLKPSLYLGAKSSAEKLVMYQVLRRVIEKIPFRKAKVTNYYQPADAVNAEVFSWLDTGNRPADHPLFLFMHYFDPHDPYFDHDKSGQSFSRVKMRNPAPDRWLGPIREAYISEIEFLDKHLGLLIDGLKQRGLYDNSVIVLTADHGEEFYDHKGWWHGETLYDEQLHVPLILKLPNQALAAQVNEHLSRSVDIAPTLLDLALAPPVEAMQGVKLIQQAAADGNAATSYSFAELDFEGFTMQSLRSLDAKLILEERSATGDPENEFFDMRQDADELSNLYGKGDARQTQFETDIEQARKGYLDKATEEQESGEMTPEEIERLKSLGYAGN